jgi:ceramide glucosyltransferase
MPYLTSVSSQCEGMTRTSGWFCWKWCKSVSCSSLPVFFPWLALLLLAISPALWPLTLLYFAYDYLVFAHFNLAYLERASPWGNSYWVTLLTLALPLQILAALLAPQRIIWRGHLMQAEAGGGFEFVQRRKK